jgi:hypothetical protein
VKTDKYKRCNSSGALVSTDLDGLRKYKEAKLQSKKVGEYGKEINNLKTEMEDIKDVLKEILNRLS